MQSRCQSKSIFLSDSIKERQIHLMYYISSKDWKEMEIASSVISRLWSQEGANLRRFSFVDYNSAGRCKIRCLAVTSKRNGQSAAADLPSQLLAYMSTTFSRQTMYRRLGDPLCMAILFDESHSQQPTTGVS
ncbi:hypothetical protein AVEN_196166-1 [Araneus ventricosus]|uniref:Uncharacterized protein n=1 Tax=Araneus ventricosus TaxID=182803 RepID=A0A4Y2RDL8_ARAVE|nr:hypothetical protein AVEN_196166-1 [Araneus ventricosus]